MITDAGTVCCDACGKDLRVGEHPFCPHGFPLVGLKQLGDEIDEWHENLGDQPIRLRSRAEKRRLLKERNLVEYVRHTHTESGQKIARWV